MRNFFKRNVLKMMSLRNMTISDLSRESHLSRNQIYSIFKKPVNCYMDTLKSLANALGCTPGWLRRR